MAGIVGSGAMAPGFSAAADGTRDGARLEVAELGDLAEQGGAVLDKSGATRRESSRFVTSVSRTQGKDDTSGSVVDSTSRGCLTWRDRTGANTRKAIYGPLASPRSCRDGAQPSRRSCSSFSSSRTVSVFSCPRRAKGQAAECDAANGPRSAAAENRTSTPATRAQVGSTRRGAKKVAGNSLRWLEGHRRVWPRSGSRSARSSWCGTGESRRPRRVPPLRLLSHSLNARLLTSSLTLTW
jgi:hypothetical protein